MVLARRRSDGQAVSGRGPGTKSLVVAAARLDEVPAAYLPLGSGRLSGTSAGNGPAAVLLADPIWSWMGAAEP